VTASGRESRCDGVAVGGGPGDERGASCRRPPGRFSTITGWERWRELLREHARAQIGELPAEKARSVDRARRPALSQSLRAAPLRPPREQADCKKRFSIVGSSLLIEERWRHPHPSPSPARGEGNILLPSPLSWRGRDEVSEVVYPDGKSGLNAAGLLGVGQVRRRGDDYQFGSGSAGESGAIATGACVLLPERPSDGHFTSSSAGVS